VPGALKFIERLKTLGIAPVYITNRNDRARAQTMSALKRFGIEVPDDQLLCATKETGSNKTSRRAQIESKFNVLIYVGDNLRDFDDRFRYDPKLGPDGRTAVVEELESKFGIDWVILPNPVYGEWNKAFSNTEQDVDLLYK
jgi:5'-nucleotidase (lipoprotein e(P4) family)